jgi:hypothetical protein
MRLFLGGLLTCVLLMTASCGNDNLGSSKTDVSSAGKSSAPMVDSIGGADKGPTGHMGAPGSIGIPGPIDAGVPPMAGPMPAGVPPISDASSRAESSGGFASPSAVASAPGASADFPAGGTPGDANDDISHNMLTAGSFDDALNLDIFSEYFGSSGLAQTKIDQLDQPQWKNLIPTFTNQNYKKLDLTFVIDVTGSMSDELSYLQKEIDKIASDVAEAFPEVEQRYSLVSYRDEGDDFVSKKFDFSNDLASFKSSLNGERASGGGDTPEAMHVALKDATDLQWGSDDSAKVLFLVADAPPHDEHIQNSFDAVFALKDKGISIYPVAASGVDDLAESIMRTSALLTGGRYIFLTDDSGIGLTHAKPKFPCYHVEKLKDVMVRMISDKLNNKRTEPSPTTLIRTVGNPINGVCASDTAQ